MNFGIFDDNQIFGSARAAATYLKRSNYRGKVYAIGGDAVINELKQLKDIELIDGVDQRNIYSTPSIFTKVEVRDGNLQIFLIS